MQQDMQLGNLEWLMDASKENKHVAHVIVILLVSLFVVDMHVGMKVLEIEEACNE